MSSSRDHRRQLYERLVGQPVANGRFVITNLLGFGGMGAVYEAVQQNMNRKVALKLIPTHDPTIVARFEREAHTISKLVHPNTVTVFDFGQSDDGFLFLSMELLEGRTLTQEIKDGPMEASRAVYVATQMCRSLAEAHKSGIVHRDVKPDNIILIEVDEDPDVVKVLDFGIAKAVLGEDDVQLTGDGRIIGTPRYMSPEQILAEPLDHRSDIYSMGCILFEMLCGAPPFQQSSTTALMISHTQDPPPAFAQQLDNSMLSEMPPGLERVVRRALAKSPNDRPQDCDEFREELEAAMTGELDPFDEDAHETVGALPPPSVSRDSLPAADAGTGESELDTAPTKGPRILLIAITALVLAIVGMIGFSLVQDGSSDDAVAHDGTEETKERSKPTEPSAVASADTNQGAELDLEPTEEPEKPKAGFVTIHIESDPQGADIYQGESLIGPTPIDIPVKAELKRHDYRLVKDGYADLPVSIHVNPEKRVQTHTYRLPQKRVAAEKPRPQPKPKPTSKPSSKPKPKPESSESEVSDGPNVEIIGDEPKANVDLLE